MAAPRSAARTEVHQFLSTNGAPKIQPVTAAETPGTPMKRANRSASFAGKIRGPHKREEYVAAATPNPIAADARGHLLKSVAT